MKIISPLTYVVFHKSFLRDVCHLIPRSTEQLFSYSIQHPFYSLRVSFIDQMF